MISICSWIHLQDPGLRAVYQLLQNLSLFRQIRANSTNPLLGIGLRIGMGLPGFRNGSKNGFGSTWV